MKSLFLLMLGAPLVIRAVCVDDHLYRFTGTRFFGAGQVLANDALIYVFILGVFYLSFLSKVPRGVSVFLRALGFLMFGA